MPPKEACRAQSRSRPTLEKNKDGELGTLYEIESLDFAAVSRLARGETLDGLKLLTDAARERI